MASLPNPEPLLHLAEGFTRSKTMFVALSVGVFDRLRKGPSTAAVMAHELATHPEALASLLDACAALGLLRKENGVYANEPVAEVYLCADSPHSLSAYVRYSDETLYPMWANLTDAVIEGSPRWMQTFGLGGPIFSSFFRTDQAMRDFARGMHGFGMLMSPKVAGAFNLRSFTRLVDLGGHGPSGDRGM
jgi:acetylserotonin O-methyltransferase